MGRGRAWGAGGAGGRALFPFIIIFEGFLETYKGWQKLPESWVLF